jgi:hypothetical protein
MKRTAIAILLLFVASLVGGAFASDCMAASREMEPGVHAPTPPCCAMKVGCTAGSCYASVHNAGCTADSGTFAVAQKGDAASGLVKIPVPVIVPIVSLTTIAHVAATRPPVPAWGYPSVAGYDDVYARTGRLLI